MDIFHTHGYKKGQQVLIDAEFLIGVLSFCERVVEQQPKVAAPLKYAKDVNIIRDDKGEVIRVDTQWEEFPSQKALALSSFSPESAVEIMTPLSLFSMQIQNAIYEYHSKNIAENIAIEIK